MQSEHTNGVTLSSSSQHKGWLRKFGGKFKTWRKRYFVLEGRRLSYYADQDEMRLLGTRSLENTVIEMPPTGSEAEHGPADSKGFTFIIKPINQEGQLNSSDSRLALCAQTDAERKSWVRAIYKALYLDAGGALFGTRLSEVFPYTKPEHRYLPRVVHDTTEFIRANGMKTEGIFRKCGAQGIIKELTVLYDTAAPSPILQLDIHSVHVAAGLLKLYFRELPESLIPFSFYERLIKSIRPEMDDRAFGVLAEVLETLPPPNYHLLRHLCKFVHEVSENQTENLMTIDNLASVLAPNLIRVTDDDQCTELSISVGINRIFSHLVRYQKQLFRLELSPVSAICNPDVRCQRSRRFNRTLDLGEVNLQPAPPPYSISSTFMLPDADMKKDSRDHKPNQIPLSPAQRTTLFELSRHQSLSNRRPLKQNDMSSNTSLVRRYTFAQSASPHGCQNSLIFPVNEGTESSQAQFVRNRLDNYDPKLIKANLNRLQLNIDLINQPSPEPLSVASARITTRPSLSLNPKASHINTLRNQGFSDPASVGDNPSSKPKTATLERCARKPTPFDFMSLNMSDVVTSSDSRSTGYDNIMQPLDPKESISGEIMNDSYIMHQSYSPYDITPNVNEFTTPDDLVQYWRNIAVNARAEAAGQQARALSLAGELNKTRCDLNIAQLEIGLLRQRLAKSEHILAQAGINGLKEKQTNFDYPWQC